MKYFASFFLGMSLAISAPAYAQDNASESEQIEPMDEIIVKGTRQNDPAMSAWLAGDYVTAEIEFNRNAFCAKRATSNFRAGVEAARDSSIQNDIGAGNNAASGASSEGGNAATATGSSPRTTINTRNLSKNKEGKRRTCEDRGYQLYMAGLSQIKLGKIEDAKESFKRATVHRKTLYDAHFRLALIEYQEGDLKKAERQFKRLKQIQNRCRKCDAKAEIAGQVQYLQNLLG